MQQFINNSIAKNNEPINGICRLHLTVDGITQGQQSICFDFLNAKINDTTYTVGLNIPTNMDGSVGLASQ